MRDVFVHEVGDMLGIDEVRAEAVRRLGSCEEAVRVEVRARRVTVTTAHGSRSGRAPESAGELPDTSVVAHDCDVFASELAEHLDRSPFPLWGSDDDREWARSALVELVQTWTPPQPGVVDIDHIRLGE